MIAARRSQNEGKQTMDTATINDELAPYVKGINELEMMLTEAAYHGVELDTVQAFIEREGFDADEIDSDLTLLYEWINTSCLEVVAIERRTLGQEDATASAVEFLIAFGGPTVRLTVLLDGSNYATVRMNWWSDSATETIITATLAEMCSDYLLDCDIS
tara:strand:+ start:224 stop:700 length:477 start_codon:yes stop_codon:yes gene_type:complete